MSLKTEVICDIADTHMSGVFFFSDYRSNGTLGNGDELSYIFVENETKLVFYLD